MKVIRLNKALDPDSENMNQLCDVIIDCAYPKNMNGVKNILREHCKVALAKYMIKLAYGISPIFIGVREVSGLEKGSLEFIPLVDMAELN